MQADDLDAFEAFFARHRALIFRTAYGLTGDQHAAEEVLQDTFVRAYRHRSTLQLDRSPVPWLHRVALNLCYSRLGRRRPDSEPIGEAATGLLGADEEPVEGAERAELREIVRAGISSLPEKQRSVVVLYYLHGLSLQETADTLGIRVGTVKSRLHYALRALRAHLEQDHRFGGAYLPLPAPPEEAEA
jgi:RNA polymerase sigma-70 factor (ECF subfamily)